jgi:predicted MFS family arabinose efflux permease
MISAAAKGRLMREETKSFNVPLIAMLTIIAALNYCDRLAISAVFPLLRADLGVSDVMLGAVGSAFLWSYALGSPIAGWLADRYSRTRMVLFSLVAWSAVTMLTGLTSDINQLLAARFLLGLAECAYLPAAAGLLADHHRPAQRGRAISIHTAGLGLGAITGATVAGFLGEHYGWRSTFLVLGALGIGLAIIAAFVLRDQEIKPAAETGAASSLSSETGADTGNVFLALAKLPSYWILLLQSMFVAIAIWIFLNWLPLFFKETFAMSLAGAGFYGAALLDFPLIFGVVAGGYISDFVARRSSPGRMLVQAVSYLIGAFLMLAFAVEANFALVAAALLGFSLLRSVAVANETPLLADLLPSRQRSTAIGLMNTANTFAGGIGVFAAGLLMKHYGLSAIFAGVSVILIVVAALNAIGYKFFLPRDLKRRRDEILSTEKL